MLSKFLYAAAVIALFALPAVAQAPSAGPPERIRGTVDKLAAPVVGLGSIGSLPVQRPQTTYDVKC